MNRRSMDPAGIGPEIPGEGVDRTAGTITVRGPGRWFAVWATGSLLMALLVGAPIRPHAQEEEYREYFTRKPADAEACKTQLNRIFEALQEYRRKYRKLPDWLSDLVPEFIDSPAIFICPFVEKTGDLQAWRDGLRDEVFIDPRLPISYAYEFCVKDYPLWADVTTTVQEYKRRQMGVAGVGTQVPIVRCLAHRPVLNLSFAGKVYESSQDWESNFGHRVDIYELLPDRLFRDLAPRPGPALHHIPPRPTDLSPRLLDLGDYYNAGLENRWWVLRNPPGNDLASLPRMVVVPAPRPVSFDARGLIQLAGRLLHAPFPERSGEIRLRQKCRRLHVLHGTVGEATAGQEIGAYEVRYTDDRELHRVPIVYGRDVLDWAFDPNRPAPGKALVAWEGINQAVKGSGWRIRLYRQEWENPRPDVEISSITFASTVTDSAPFLVAVTIE